MALVCKCSLCDKLVLDFAMSFFLFWKGWIFYFSLWFLLQVSFWLSWLDFGQYCSTVVFLKMKEDCGTPDLVTLFHDSTNSDPSREEEVYLISSLSNTLLNLQLWDLRHSCYGTFGTKISVSHLGVVFFYSLLVFEVTTLTNDFFVSQRFFR